MEKIGDNEYLCISYGAIGFMLFMLLHYFFWPSNILDEELIKQFDLYYNSSVIMDISINCDNKSNNILGYFGGIPEGRTYTQKPKQSCPDNPVNYIVGKCKENPWYDYDICDKNGGAHSVFDKNKCVTIKEVKPIYYNYFNEVPLCSNIENNLNYYTLIKNSTITIDDCLKQKNMKVCGILDDLNQIVCLHKNYSCPINDIIFNKNPTYYIKINETIINYDNIKINDDLYIHFTNNNINKKIISNFNISLNKPCSHMYQSTLRYNLFIAYDFIYCYEYNNNLFEYIYYENATKFMKNNSLYSIFQQFKTSKFNDFNVNLFSSFYFGFNKTCILENNFNENSFKDYLSKYSSFKGFYITFTVFFFLFITSMIMPSFMLEEYDYIPILIHGILLIISLLFLIISHILFQKISSLFDCRNTNIDFIQLYQTFRKKKKGFIYCCKNMFYCLLLYYIS